MGSYDGAEVCELVSLFVLNNLRNKFVKNSIGLYRDDGLPLFKSINRHCTINIRKEFHKLLKKNEVPLEM